MHLHFLRAIGTAMSMRAGIAADAAAALLFRILSQPALLFPPLRQVEGVEVQHEPLVGYLSSYRKQVVYMLVVDVSLTCCDSSYEKGLNFMLYFILNMVTDRCACS